MGSKDNVYSKLKLILCINCICGLFSVKNGFGDSCKKLRFEIFSWPQVYLLILMIGTISITAVVDGPGHFRRYNFTIEIEYLIWICVMNYTNRIYIKVISKIQTLDCKEKYSLGKLTTLWICFIYMLYLCTYSCHTYVTIYNSNEKFITGIIECCFSYMVSTRTLATLPYIATTNIIGNMFSSLAKEMKDFLYLNLSSSNDALIEIEKYRMIHLKLCSVSDSLISCFSLPITLFFGLAYYDMLIKVRSIVELKNFDTLVDPMYLVVSIMDGYLIISASEDLFQASQRVGDVIKEFPLLNKPNKFHTQLKQFSLQIKSTSIKVTAGNYFLLRKRSFPGIVGSMTSFLVVVVQLYPYYTTHKVLNNITESAHN